MVQKKSGKWRMCIDFTSLNKAYPKDNFPLPRINKIVDSAAGYEVMSLLDCFSGYHQIYMKEEDKASTSFITPFGTYCFVRMPEGLKNAGSTFSRLTKTVLESQVGRNIFTYVDDIVVASKNKKKSSGRPRRNIREHAGSTTSPKPREVHLWSSPGEVTGLPGVAPRDRGQPDQDSGYHQHDASAVKQRRQRLIGRLAALNRFISKSAKQSLPFLKTLRGAKDFAWGPEQAAPFASLK
jgi:hypothetical protein